MPDRRYLDTLIARRQPSSDSPTLRASSSSSERSFRIEIDDPSDRTLANSTETDIVASEHEAIDLGAIKPMGLVARSFEGSYLAGMLMIGKMESRPVSNLAKELVHDTLFDFLSSQLAASMAG